MKIEESRGRVHKLRITSLGKLPHGYVVYESVAIQLAEDIIKSVGSCGKCKHLNELGVCFLHTQDSGAEVTMMDTDFCSYFERKD